MLKLLHNCTHLTCYQVMLKILEARVQQYMYNELPDVQAGCRKGRGTRDQIANIQQMLAIWSVVSLPFLKQAWTSGSSQFMYFWSLAWRILSITLLVWDECNCAVVWAFFGIAFLCGWNENWPFPVLWSLLSFPNLLAYWVQHFHSIIF